tara:strand:- start:7373 stop:8812 length:1440 start_codon:yes stop_codon:yes gene_type:complete
MRLWPRSLAGQLIIWLLLVLMLAQVFTLLLYLGERNAVVRTANHAEVLSRTASMVRLLNTTPVDLHKRIIRSASGPRLRFWLSDKNLLTPGEHPRIKRALERMLGDGIGDIVVDIRMAGNRPFRKLRKAWRQERDGAAAHLDRQELRLRPRPADERKQKPRRRFLDLSMAVQIRDGRWINVETLVSPAAPRFAITTVLTFAAMTVAIIVIVVFVVRRATRPLGELAVAAERFGRGETVEPLVERGPKDVASAIGAFNQMREQLTAFVHARTQMLAAVAHDLRSPLTSLRLRAEMIDDNTAREKMIASLDEMQQMIEASLSFFRADGAEEASRTIDLPSLAQTVAEEFKDQGQAVHAIADDIVSCQGKPLALRRALRNLIDNATNYGHKAEVRVLVESGIAVVSVCDEGPGIPPEDMERVTAPFVRLEESRSRATGGVGMGLAIAASVAQAHGGELRLSNRDGGGLCVEVRLPVSARTTD